MSITPSNTHSPKRNNFKFKHPQEELDSMGKKCTLKSLFYISNAHAWHPKNVLVLVWFHTIFFFLSSNGVQTNGQTIYRSHSQADFFFQFKQKCKRIFNAVPEKTVNLLACLKILFFPFSFLIFITLFFLVSNHRIRHLSEAKIVWCRAGFFSLSNCYMLVIGYIEAERHQTVSVYTHNENNFTKKVSEPKKKNHADRQKLGVWCACDSESNWIRTQFVYKH